MCMCVGLCMYLFLQVQERKKIAVPRCFNAAGVCIQLRLKS